MGRKLEYPRECKHCDAKGTDGVLFRHRTCCLPCFERRKTTREYKTPAYIRENNKKHNKKVYVPVKITKELGLRPVYVTTVGEKQHILDMYFAKLTQQHVDAFVTPT